MSHPLCHEHPLCQSFAMNIHYANHLHERFMLQHLVSFIPYVTKTVRYADDGCTVPSRQAINDR
jgi:hypothetical protein